MKASTKTKEEHVHVVLRRMREAADLTMREVGAMIGVSHVTISQFENGKLDLPDYRIEQLVKAYGLDMQGFNKILGRPLVGNPKDDCHSMIDRLEYEQLVAVSAILRQIVRISRKESAQVSSGVSPQSSPNIVSISTQEGSNSGRPGGSNEEN